MKLVTEAKVPPVALVTGGAIRVGRAISLALAGAGHDLVVAYRSSANDALSLQAELSAMGRACEIVQADLTDPEAPAALVGAARKRFGRLDVLVNSAAGFDRTPLLEADAALFDSVMALNARGPHLLVRAASELLTESGGCVVNIVDLSAFQPWVEYPIHAVSKAALAHLTRVQARVLAPRVRVNGIAPGAVLPPDDWTDERARSLAEIAPLQKLGSAEDVADTVLYLVGAGFVTGQIIAVDGGRMLGSAGPPTN